MGLVIERFGTEEASRPLERISTHEMMDSNNMNVSVISLRYLFQANKHIRGVMKMFIVCGARRNTRLYWHE